MSLIQAFRKPLRLSLIGLISFGLTLIVQVMPGQSPALMAQTTLPTGGYTILVEAAAQQVYEIMPELPRANTYKRQEDGEVDPENTLVSRLIRYHRDIKRRPTRYRFDWKLTLADYLGLNEDMRQEHYPGFSTLQSSPLDADKDLIDQLSRRERLTLVNTLAKIYSPGNIPNQTPTNAPDGSTIQREPNTSEPAVVEPDKNRPYRSLEMPICCCHR